MNAQTNKTTRFPKKPEAERHRLPVLKTRKDDLTKRWYVEYYITDTVKNELIRQVKYQPTKLKTATERRKWGNSLVRAITGLLEEGYYKRAVKRELAPIPEPIKFRISPEVITVKGALDLILDIKKNELRQRSADSYKNAQRRMIDYLTYTQQLGLLLKDLSPRHIYEFSDYLISVRKVSNRYRNNLIAEVRSLFNELKKREYIKENPAKEIVPLRQAVTRRNMAFTAEQQATLEEYLKQHDLPMYYFTRFVYQAFIRPLELCQLQVRDIELEHNRIAMHGSIVKAVRKDIKTEYLLITPPLREVILSMNLDACQPTDYVFSKNFRPGKKRLIRNRVSERHREALDVTGLYNGEITLYSWKHTGVVNGFRAGVPIEWLQLQLRHRGLEETCGYLKSLGLMLHQRTDIPSW